MNRILLYICFTFIVAGCNNDNSVQEAPKQVVKVAKKDTVSIQPKKPKPKNLINDENVEAKLLAFGEENKESVVKFYTTKGVITARLYKDTPLHRANFIMLAKKGYFTRSVFTRVAKNFIAQTGDTYDEDKVEIRRKLGYYTVPAEINKRRFHKQGAIGAARSYDENPEKRSHAAQFYFIEGNQFNGPTLDKYEESNNYKYPAAHREYYINNKGSAHLDGQHTVFGEIISGFEVVPKLTSVATSSSDSPLEDLFIDSVIIVK